MSVGTFRKSHISIVVLRHESISRNASLVRYRREEFWAHYHKRSKLKSTPLTKRKFGDSLRSKTDTAMVSEALCWILWLNLVMLIHEIHELGVDVFFGF